MRIARILLAVVVLGVAAYLLLVGLAQPRPHGAYVDALPAGVVVLAHQGGDGVWPGNTLFAFQHAVDAGVDVLELDVHASADGVLMVIHDDTVDRTSDGTGAVADLTAVQLQALDAGYRWSPAGHGESFPYRGRGITIPTLQQVFDAFPHTSINIEIKPDDPEVAMQLCSVVQANGRSRDVMVGSFHGAALRAFRKTCPIVATSADPGETRLFFVLARARLAATFTPRMDAFQVPETQGNLTVVTPHFVAAALKRGLRVDVWTVNDTDDMRRLIDMGVNGIITDRPDRALALLGRRSSVELPEGVTP